MVVFPLFLARGSLAEIEASQRLVADVTYLSHNPDALPSSLQEGTTVGLAGCMRAWQRRVALDELLLADRPLDFQPR